jgi:hypothetical protein
MRRYKSSRYSICSSARAGWRDGQAQHFAVFRLIPRSKRVGCCMGSSSAGEAPLKLLPSVLADWMEDRLAITTSARSRMISDAGTVMLSALAVSG